MTEFITRNYGNENFEIIIKTDSKEHYKATENFARWLIDHAKPTFTIEAKPIVHAHWKNWGCQGTVCSNCHGRVLYECDEQEEKSKFCPWCGAQMDENHIAEVGKKEGE